MSLDVGTKHIGIAITDASRRHVAPVGSVSRRTGLTDDRMSPESLTHLSKRIQQHVNEQRAIGKLVHKQISFFQSIILICFYGPTIYRQELFWDSRCTKTEI